jgi:hypothetical protein
MRHVEALVTMLEEHLSDIRLRLAADSWRRFVELLDQSVQGLSARRQDLEKWAALVSSFLYEFDYTKGLVHGLAIGTRVKPRAVPVDIPCSNSQPAAASTRSPVPSAEEALVERISGLARRARGLP